MQRMVFIMHLRGLAGKPRKKSAACWSVLHKFITMHSPQNLKI
jgi:hypothetical protein